MTPWQWLQEAKAAGKLTPEEEEILAVLLAPIEEDVKFVGRNGLTVVPRKHAEDRARRAFGPFGYGLHIKDMETMSAPDGQPVGIRILATFWADIPGRGRYATDVVAFAPFERMEQAESWGSVYNRAVKTARGDALKQGLFSLGYGWDLREDDEPTRNGRPEANGRAQPAVSPDAPLTLTAVVRSFVCRPPKRREMVIYRFKREGDGGAEYYVTALTASVQLPDQRTLDQVELAFSSKDGVLGLADRLRVGHQLRVRGVIKETKGSEQDPPYLWIRVLQAEILNDVQGPTFAEWVAQRQDQSGVAGGEG